MAVEGSGIRIVIFDEQQKFVTPLRTSLIEPIELFHEFSVCISFIEQETSEKKAIILLTTTVIDSQLQTFDAIPSVEFILILSTTEIDLNTFPDKVIGVYTQFEPLIRSLSEIFDQMEQQLDINSVLIHQQKDGKDNLAFYLYILWKNYGSHETNNKKSLADQARLLYRSNNQIRATINDFESNYKATEVLNWLDKHRRPFPYRLLISNGLRTQDQDILSHSRFFFMDLIKQMKLTTASNNEVYLGAKLPMTTVDILEQHSTTGIIAFQCFFTMTRSRAGALAEATRPTRRHHIANVLFKINLNHVPCATIGDTLIVEMATHFRLVCVTRSSGSGGGQQQLIIIKLVALDKNEVQQMFDKFIQKQKDMGRTPQDLLKQLADKISNDEAQAVEHMARSEWAQAAAAFARISNPNVRVLNTYGCLLREHIRDLTGSLDCHQRALIKAKNKEKAETLIYLGMVQHSLHHFDEAFECYSQALSWLENEKKRDPAMIARCLVGIGNAHWARGQLDEAFDFAERALDMREHEVKPKNEYDIAACLGNMGNILHDQGDIQRALACATRAVDLLTNCDSPSLRLAAALNNLGALHQSNRDLVKARQYFEQALASLPKGDHPYRTSTLNNIAKLDIFEQANK